VSVSLPKDSGLFLILAASHLGSSACRVLAAMRTNRNPRRQKAGNGRVMRLLSLSGSAKRLDFAGFLGERQTELYKSSPVALARDYLT